mmetsp:Transcript_17075/g.24154  ORF Transcript_17075/g.24154 Transcript_17075/m.24154 type:complete len:126 (+) Transcript_17075:1089-1466(+)
MSGGGRFQWDVNKIPSTPVKTEKTAQPSGESNLLKLCALDSGHLSNQFCGGVIGTKTSGGKMCINQHCNVAKHKVTKAPLKAGTNLYIPASTNDPNQRAVYMEPSISTSNLPPDLYNFLMSYEQT